ncbi:hypothetical protein diail_2580 [Diaporthe ilicicola]|nr:hypothetical protein diail_2580 [Diaporthe ilicicola]
MSFFKDITPNLKFDAQSDVPRHPLTGIKVLIVGAGPAGLYTALECWRKGHNPRVIERVPSPSLAGDSFLLGPSAQQHVEKHWPAVYAAALETAADPWMSFHKGNGEKVADAQSFSYVSGKEGELKLNEDGEPAPNRVYRVSRPKFNTALLEQVLALGIDVTYGRRAVDYFEDETKAGVILEDGSKIDADVVVAADGLGTKSHKLINGHDIRAVSSKHSIFRTAYHVDHFASDPELDSIFPLRDDGGALHQIWTTNDLQIKVLRARGVVEWHIVHNDIAGTSQESWANKVSPEYVVEFLKENYPEVPEYLHKLVRTAPQDAIIDWQLLWRDPQPNVASPLGRVVQVGDSAHTFLPSSGNGAVQGIEDAISLATCLELGGGLRNGPWSKLLGFLNQTNFLKPETRTGAGGGSIAPKPQYGRWIWAHNPERYAYENYGKALRNLVEGTPFQNTNIPPG